MNPWREQFDRVRRFLERIEDQDRDSTDYDDDLWAFFQNCWHLKDWTKHDGTLDVNFRNNLEEEVQKYLSIKICADLANRSKHSILTSHIRVDAEVIQRDVTIRLNAPIHDTTDKICSSIYTHIITTDDGKKYSALDIARQAVVDWGQIFNDNNIIIV